VVSTLALTAALGTCGAYAANTISTGDIVDNQVTSADVRDDNLGFGGLAAKDIGAGAIGSSEAQDNSLTGADIANSSLTSSDVAPGAFTGSEIANDSLTGADINEGSLNLPPTTTATTSGQGSVTIGDQFTRVTGKTLSPGSWAVVATANVYTGTAFGGDQTRDTVCELRNQGNWVDGATDRRTIPSGQAATISLSMNGGTQMPAGGGDISVACRWQGGGAIGDAQITAIKLDGFS
jgi:hypothetical protein